MPKICGLVNLDPRRHQHDRELLHNCVCVCLLFAETWVANSTTPSHSTIPPLTYAGLILSTLPWSHRPSFHVWHPNPSQIHRNCLKIIWVVPQNSRKSSTIHLRNHAGSLRQGWVDEASPQKGLSGALWAHGAKELLSRSSSGKTSLILNWQYSQI